MTLVSVFYQACPICGRSLRIPVQYFGQSVACVHCHGEFRAEQQCHKPLAAVRPLFADLGPVADASGSMHEG